ncbi:hypoxanthine phosphoribosyltransferase [Pedobacter sp. N36a]|uniref:hypoxanthine phosphoribosyltransferase n=1 Tax=Pedobacter sp. N36a TaxID=2767996 RepID=UPI001656C8F5|nr:hypoxanthine phosphoribosyltransferase [Pedobacter sp. N36a]MBC8987080.1 hypoxanthine phosphoribosyltransferase [Pedobacter sp. N36a]
MNTIKVLDKDFDILLENDNIMKRTRLIGIQMNVDYENRNPLFIGVLNGSFLFMADLVKEITVPCEMTFIRVSSYKDTQSTGEIKEIFGLPENLENRDIIIVEDIVDTGFTLSHILKEIYKQTPASVSVCSLLLKPDALKVQIDELEYVGFEIANDFVVGYGLDYNGYGRNLNHIYTVKTVANPLP